MTRLTFEQKYAVALQGIIDADNDTNDLPGVQRADITAASPMLKEMVRKQDPTIYRGLPAGFDLEECLVDLESITD